MTNEETMLTDDTEWPHAGSSDHLQEERHASLRGRRGMCHLLLVSSPFQAVVVYLIARADGSESFLFRIAPCPRNRAGRARTDSTLHVCSNGSIRRIPPRAQCAERSFDSVIDYPCISKV